MKPMPTARRVEKDLHEKGNVKELCSSCDKNIKIKLNISYI